MSSAQDPDGKPVWADDIGIDDLGLEEGEEIPFEQEEEAYDPSAPVKKEKKDKKKKKDKKGKGKAEEVTSDAEEMEAVIEEGLDTTAKEALADDLDELYQLDHEDMVCLPFLYLMTIANVRMTRLAI